MTARIKRDHGEEWRRRHTAKSCNGPKDHGGDEGDSDDPDSHLPDGLGRQIMQFWPEFAASESPTKIRRIE